MIKKIAVTGTKGKSTTLRLLQAGFMDLQYNVYGTFGVDGYYYNNQLVRPGDSCKDYLEIDQLKYPSDIHLMEATSFTLKHGIFDSVQLDCALFTSFDETEHSEIHPGGDYIQSKRKIFSLLKDGARAIVCRDIKQYNEIVDGYESRIISYGFHPESDYVLGMNLISQEKMIFSLNFEENSLFFKSRILGSFNALNIAAAWIAARVLEQDEIKFFRSMESFSGFAGRMERYRIPKISTDVVIDYAHTNESLEVLLQTCRDIYPDRQIITIFGCGGDKSKEKRSKMGKTSEKLSNLSILTNDNPRSEAPLDIIADIISEIENKDSFHVIADRSEAIKSCLNRSRGCVIVIAGKGAEHEITIGDRVFYHNDRECLIEWCYQNNLTLVNMCNPEI
jgi:UDP-N-acetylmuramoyl-L-alanyl-D-glutamate--2,6-diaminopimelate ligase